jgi:membrane protein required for colicin V production
MNTFDVMLLGLACVLVVLGMLKGLVRILIGLGALVAAFAVAARFHAGLAERLAGWDIGDEALRLVAYLLIFVGVMLAAGLVAFFVGKLVRAAMLGWADRLGGAALGLVAALLAAALIVLPLLAYSPHGERILARSVLAPYVAVVADLATRLAPSDLGERYRRKIQHLRRQWHRQVLEARAPDLPRA